MAISIIVDGKTFPSRMAYYRSIEDQGNRSISSYYMHMRLKHDREFYEKEVKRSSDYIKKRYHNDAEFKNKLNERRRRCYHDHKKQNVEKNIS